MPHFDNQIVVFSMIIRVMTSDDGPKESKKQAGLLIQRFKLCLYSMNVTHKPSRTYPAITISMFINPVVLMLL